MNTRTLTALILSLSCTGLVAQEKVVRLYEGPAPGSENWKQEEKENRTNAWQTRIVFNVVNPTLTVFRPDPSNANGTALVICPGGAFFALSIVGRSRQVEFPPTRRRCSSWPPPTIRSGWRRKASRFTRTGLQRKSPPSCTSIQRGVTASVCESKTC